MKKNTFLNIFAILITATVFMFGCKKEEQTKLAPMLGTTKVVDITETTANATGLIIAGASSATEKGICWNTQASPTTANSKAVATSSTGATYSVKLTGLVHATKYYARAYAIIDGAPVYSEDFVFTAGSIAPILTTTAATAVTGTTATSGGNVTDNGGEEVTARGVCWAVGHLPTVNDSKTSDLAGSGAFTSSITNLLGATTYRVRAYATNKIGTSYGPEVSLNTLVAPPVVAATKAVTGIAVDGGVSGGEVTYNGGAVISDRGVCLSTVNNPTVSDIKASSGAGEVGTFTTNVTGLTKGTKYYVRAYATNSAGTSYGPEISFTTISYPANLYMIGDGVSQAGVNNEWDWSKNDLPLVPVNGKPNLFWKIVWLNATGGFKFSPVKAWAGDFGATIKTVSPNGEYSKGSENIAVPGTAGYYMVVVDLDMAKIAVADPKVYLIGNTVGSWNSGDAANLFTVDNANSVVTITKTLAADNIRMYAAHPWIPDWWRAEFNIFSGAISFRGIGGDQVAVPVTAGSKTVSLNFMSGAGSIQ